MNKTPNTSQSSSKYALKKMFEMQAKKLKKVLKRKGVMFAKQACARVRFLSNAANKKKDLPLLTPKFQN